MTAITPAEAAKELRISKAMVYKLIHTQGLPHIRLGRRVIIPRDRLDQWLKEQTRERSLA